MAMSLTRRAFCGSLAIGGLLAAAPAGAGVPVRVTDMTGRTVSLPTLPKRIILLEARDIVSMALLHPDPGSVVVGWAATARIDSGLLREQYEKGHRIQVVGKLSPDTVSIEGLAALSPDLVVATSYMTPSGSSDLLLRTLDNLGIPVIFSDTSSNFPDSKAAGSGPITDMHNQMRMWGEVLGVPEKAHAFTEFFDSHLEAVSSCVAGVPPITTYLEVQSTIDDCCWAAGNDVWGKLLERAGGRNLPAVTAPWYQQLQLEYLLSTPHEVYIASGGGWASGNRPAIGPGLDPTAGRKGLERLTERTGFGQLSSVRHKRVHGIWTGLIAVPAFNILFIEIVARWLHPGPCASIDPDATLTEINERFLQKPLDGPLWISIEEHQ